jgi:hypothetical protein
VLDDTRAFQFPSLHDGGAIFLLESDRDVTQCSLVSVSNVIKPPVEIRGANDTALERHVGVFVQPRNFSNSLCPFVAVAILGRGEFHTDVTALLEAGMRPVLVANAEIHQKVELCVGTFACHSLWRLEAFLSGLATCGVLVFDRWPR